MFVFPFKQNLVGKNVSFSFWCTTQISADQHGKKNCNGCMKMFVFPFGAIGLYKQNGIKPHSNGGKKQGVEPV